MHCKQQEPCELALRVRLFPKIIFFGSSSESLALPYEPSRQSFLKGA